MKRSVFALGILGLVYAVSLPGASAQTVLFQDNFDTDAFLKASTTYIQGVSTAIMSDDTIRPFYIRGGKLTSNAEDGSGAASDGTGANHIDDDPPGVPFQILFGDKSWADVSIQARVYSDGGNTGSFGLLLRAAPKTKPTDPDTWYEFQYTTANSVTGETDPTDECLQIDEKKSGIEAPGVVPNLRILKAVKNKYTLLAETDFNKSSVHIPEINTVGADHDDQPDGDGSTGTPTGAVFRFVAKGNVLQAFCSLDGVTFNKYLEVTDNELTAGVAGLTHCEYPPVFDDLLVTTAP
jgi:hypothetical protein